MNNNKHLINYVDYKHSYVHALEPKLKKINYYANVLKKPAGYMYKMVTGILNDCEDQIRWTDKEQEFVSDLHYCYTGTQIYFRVKNAIEYAKANTFVYVDDDGELAE